MHDELLQRTRRGRQPQRLVRLSSNPGHHMGADEEYDPAEDCLHVKCKVRMRARMLCSCAHSHMPTNRTAAARIPAVCAGQLLCRALTAVVSQSGGDLKKKWGADGEPLDGHVPENVGDVWGEYGASGIGFKGKDNHAEAKLAPCLGATCKLLHGEKWDQDGEPLDGHVPENVGDKWGAYGASGVGFRGVDEHVAAKLPLCLGSKCKQLHGEKWGADGEPLDGHTRENIGDTWGEYGSSGIGYQGVDEHVAAKLPPCLGSKCKQLHGEKWGADGEPLEGHTRENIGDTWGEYGASGRAWKGVDKHKDFASPFACLGKACKLKKLSMAGHSNVGEHFSKFGALGKPYTGTGKYVDRSDSLPPCLGGNASPCKVPRMSPPAPQPCSVNLPRILSRSLARFICSCRTPNTSVHDFVLWPPVV